MRPVLLVAALLLSAVRPAAAQVPIPTVPFTIWVSAMGGAGSLSVDEVTASGATGLGLGFSSLEVDPRASIAYNVVDISGLLSLVTCAALPCSGLSEERAGSPTADTWTFVDGALVPRIDVGTLYPTPIGGVGFGAHLSSSGAASDNDRFGWFEGGPQIAYAGQLGPAAVLATGTYVWGVEGDDSSGLTLRAIKLRADATVPLGRTFRAVGFVAYDNRTDSDGTDDPADDFNLSFLTVGVGVGF